MEKPKKRGPRIPVRKKRLQLDLQASQASIQSTSDAKLTDQSVSHDETNAKESDITESTHPTDSSMDVTTSRPKSASPEPNCAICLGKLENKSFTDSCFHTFCFVCLEEWSKVKPECPLCKQKFKSIIHNVRSLDDYDQHHVGLPNETIELNYEYPNGQRFRYRTTITDHRYAFAQIWERERQNRMLQRPSRYTPVPNWRRLRQPASSEFRRSIYDQRLRIKEDQVNTRRRVRETSPSFFRENPAQTHRLVPWLNRELNALLDDHGSQVAFVLELIMGLIKRFQIGSDEFYEHLYPFIGRRTRQFMDEFLHFARSPQQMAGYDRQVEYEPQERKINHDSGSDSDTNRNDANRTDEGNDSDVIVVSPSSTSPNSGPESYPGAPILHSNLDPWERSLLRAQDPSYLGFPPIVRSTAHDDLTNITDFIDQTPRRNPPCTSDWDEPTPSVSSFIACGDRTITGTVHSSRHNPSTIINELLFGNLHLPPVPTSTSAPPIVSNPQAEPISFIDSDNESTASDIMIVDYEKPWTERSPIKLSSGEESDFELMIVGTSYPTDPVKKESKKRDQNSSNKECTTSGGKRKNREENDRAQSGRQHKKRRKKSRSRSRSLPRSYLPQPHQSDSDRVRQRSHSRSPIRMRFSNYSNYLHKKYHYHHPRGSAHKAKTYHSLSGSSTDTGTDDEAHVSIRSRKEKSRSGHSSIEIVEYRKKSSKYKKGKKHSKSRSSDRERFSGDTVIKGRKHKKDKTDDKHKHSKKKSKHKKHKLAKKGETRSRRDYEKNKSPNNQLYGDSGDDRNIWKKDISTKGLNKNESVIGTSDSDLDSATDNEIGHYGSFSPEHVNDAPLTDHTKTPINDVDTLPTSDMVEPFTNGGFNSLPFQLVELSPFESAEFEKELKSITKNVPISQPSYSGGQNRGHVSQKSFKKHPHGHKKSSQKRAGQEDVHTVAYSTITSPVCKMLGNLEESNIQSSDITSCTDIGKDFSHPDDLNTAKEDNSLKDGSHCRTSVDESPRLNLQSFGGSPMKSKIFGRMYESPSSSGFPNLDIVDVETLSDDSDIDVTHIDYNAPEEKTIDVEKLSDSESDKNSENGLVTVNHAEGENNEELIDVVGSSDEEIDVQKVDERHPTLKSLERVAQSCFKGRFSITESNCTGPFQEKVHEDPEIIGDFNSDNTEHLKRAKIHSPQNGGVSDQLNRKDETKTEHILPSGSVIHVEDDISLSNSDFSSSVHKHGTDGMHTKFQAQISNCNQNDLSDGKDIEVEESTSKTQEKSEDAHLWVEQSSVSCKENVDTIGRGDSNSILNEIIDSDNKIDCNILPSRDIKNHSEAECGPSDGHTSPFAQSALRDTDHVSQCNIEKEKKDNKFDYHVGTRCIPDNPKRNRSMAESDTYVQGHMDSATHTDINQLQDNSDSSRHWTSNQILDGVTSNIEPSSFLESFSTAIDESRPYASPPYIATLYDNRNSGSLISPDLTYESVSQNSPGQPSPSSTVSDNIQDSSFIPED